MIVHPWQMNAAVVIMDANVSRFNCVQLPKQEHPENYVAIMHTGEVLWGASEDDAAQYLLWLL